MSLSQDKSALRTTMLARRAAMSADERTAAAAGLLATFQREQPFRQAPVVSGFWPMGDELDIRPLMQELAGQGSRIALPVVLKRGEPLLFREWRPGDVLDKGVFGTSHPSPLRETLEPDALLVPLLACDGNGWRLGYGGGFYDRTLLRLRNRKEIVAVGVGFNSQVVPEVPHGPEDQSIDWLLTDKRAYAFV